MVQKSREVDREAGKTVPTLILEPVVLEIELRRYQAPAPPSSLASERQRRLIKMDDWIKDRAQEKAMSPRQTVESLHVLNFNIAQQTEYDGERIEGARRRFQEDFDALQTQISIHKEVGDMETDYHWALARSEIVSRVLERLQLNEQLKTAEQHMLHGGPVEDPAENHPTIPGEPAVRKLLHEVMREYRALIKESKAEASVEFQRLRMEIAEHIANDPDYHPPLSASSSSLTSSTPAPITPPHINQGSGPDTSVILPGSADRSDQNPRVSPPLPLAQKRKHEEMSDPSPQLYYTPDINLEIRKRERVIHAKKTSLRAFAMTESASGHRKKLQRDIDDLQSKLDLYKSTSGTSLPPGRDVSPPVRKESDFGVGFRSRR